MKLYSKALFLSAMTLSVAAHSEVCEVPGSAELKTMPHVLDAADQEIIQLERETCPLVVAGEVDTLMDRYIAEHGVILLDRGEVAIGREGQRQMFKDFLAAGFQIIYEPADAKVSADGTMAWAIGAYQLTLPTGEVEVGKYTSIWEKIDGRWQNVIEMRNPNG
ncbi:MAG: nuclear transport factor 2 family protein [Pseudomonadota bacterium]